MWIFGSHTLSQKQTSVSHSSTFLVQSTFLSLISRTHLLKITVHIVSVLPRNSHTSSSNVVRHTSLDGTEHGHSFLACATSFSHRAETVERSTASSERRFGLAPTFYVNRNGQKRNQCSEIEKNFIDPGVEEFEETPQNTKRKLERRMTPAMPSKRTPISFTKVFANLVTNESEKTPTTNYVCLVEFMNAGNKLNHFNKKWTLHCKQRIYFDVPLQFGRTSLFQCFEQ